MMHTKQMGLSVEDFISFALSEDVGDGDYTSLSTVDESKFGRAEIKIKEYGILSGISLAKKIFQTVDPTLEIQALSIDGNEVSTGEIVMNIDGSVRSLLKAERLVLNCMQRMSGIASQTRKYVLAVAGTDAKILDTRKTTPNFRQFEKQAVLDGGGMNHRFGLFDMILIKDNHVDASGGIRNALLKTADYMQLTGRKFPVEIETRNLQEVEEVMSTGIADRIMLDNFSPHMLKKAISIIRGKIETEASGGITLENIREYALTGVQYISVGALTHSYRSLDISMKLISLKN
jgi:nicotinate-nucleotide pyrophosphorylase (carboxylating)